MSNCSDQPLPVILSRVADELAALGAKAQALQDSLSDMLGRDGRAPMAQANIITMQDLDAMQQTLVALGRFLHAMANVAPVVESHAAHAASGMELADLRQRLLGKAEEKAGSAGDIDLF